MAVLAALLDRSVVQIAEAAADARRYDREAIRAAFDLSDTRGVVLDPRSDGIAVSVGANGRLRAEAAEYSCDDRSWHRSAAGRSADAVTPPRGDREAAFRDLIRARADRGGPVLARTFAGILRSTGRDDLIEVGEDPVRAPSPLTATPRTPEPRRAALVMAAWTAARAGYRTGHPAEPHAFRLTGAAFQGPGALARTGKATGPSSLDLHQGALYVATEEGWSAAVLTRLRSPPGTGCSPAPRSPAAGCPRRA